MANRAEGRHAASVTPHCRRYDDLSDVEAPKSKAWRPAHPVESVRSKASDAKRRAGSARRLHGRVSAGRARPTPRPGIMPTRVAQTCFVRVGSSQRVFNKGVFRSEQRPSGSGFQRKNQTASSRARLGKRLLKHALRSSTDKRVCRCHPSVIPPTWMNRTPLSSAARLIARRDRHGGLPWKWASHHPLVMQVPVRPAMASAAWSRGPMMTRA